MNADIHPPAAAGHAGGERSRRLPGILVVSPIYPWPGSPAEGIFLHRQVRALADLGHPVRVINFHPAVPGLPRPLVGASWLRYHPRWIGWPRRQDGIDVDHVFHHQRARNRVDAVPVVAEVVARHLERNPGDFVPEVVYGNWLWTGGAVAVALRERSGWPVAAIARGSELHRWQRIHRHCLAHVRDVVASADLVLANCEFLRRRAAAMEEREAASIPVAYNGCDTGLFRPAGDRARVRRELGLADGCRYFLCCATVTEHKGLGDLAVAWERFARGNRGWRLMVLGPVAQPALARALRGAAGGTVELRGRVAAADVPRYLQAADGYVQPSRLEGLSNATMEAMATGLPVVTTDAGGQRELVDGVSNGWIVPAGDPPALAEAMRELAGDRRLSARRGLAARQTIASRFEAGRQAQRLSGLLTALADRARGAPVGAGAAAPPRPTAAAVHAGMAG